MSRFRKEFLPPARSFYQQLGELGRPNRKGWALGNCPFHQSKSRTSFSVNLDSGSFCCFGCGVKGTDIVSFVMQRDRLTFKQACQRLDCWGEDGKRSKHRPGPLLRYLVMDFTIDGTEYHAEVPDEPKTELERLRRFYAEAKVRLSEIRQGDAEKVEGEAEAQWSIFADSWELIQMELADAK